MTTSKWALRLAKLGVITWLIANTGVFNRFSESWNQEVTASEIFLDSLQENYGGWKVWEHEAKLNRFVLARTDSVKALIAKGHRYQAADYFRDLKDIWDYADQVTPWSRFTLGMSELVSLQDRDESLTSQEQAALRCELLGVCEKSEPIDWDAVARWCLHQYILGLFPSLIMCLILARQGRIRFNMRKSPVSSLLYLALWPINLVSRVIVAFQDIDREARLRLQKDSLFSRLSGLEEGFLDSLRQHRDHNELLVRRSYSFGYVLAIVAVIVMRVAPVVAQSTSETEKMSMIEVAHHDPPDCGDDEDDDSRDLMLIFTFGHFITEAKWRTAWWPRNVFDILVGFGRGVLHVPLVSTA
jgi:hypothetical protein